MWIHCKSGWHQWIRKITGIYMFLHNDESEVEIMADQKIYSFEFSTEKDCQEFFEDVQKNLGNSNKILRHGKIEDL